MSKDNQFLGTGWAFPPSFDSDSRAASMCSNEQDIKQSLMILLSTAPGERIMHPDYGCAIHRYVFSELNQTLLSELESEVRRAVLLFESRVDLHSVILTADPASATLHIQLEYNIITTNTRDNMVFPFYLQEGTLIRSVPIADSCSRQTP
ncbi:GPW/gp25 family protein [Vibrio sp. WXL103]|uniref:GPW/gp25 family protein n=1 Tax=Vibrio sp. WXL103 TaxID=3450710 RepID=UPI003EC63C21